MRIFLESVLRPGGERTSPPEIKLGPQPEATVSGQSYPA